MLSCLTLCFSVIYSVTKAVVGEGEWDLGKERNDGEERNQPGAEIKVLTESG